MSYNIIERSDVPLTKEDFASDQMVKWCQVAVHMPFWLPWKMFSLK